MITDTFSTNALVLFCFLGLSYWLLWDQYRRQMKRPSSPPPTIPKPQPSLIKAEVDPILVDTADSLIYGLISGKGKSCSDQELLEAIGRRLSNYTWLENPDFVRALNFYLQTEGQRLTGKSFPLPLLEAAWEKVRRIMEMRKRDADYFFIVHPKNQFQ